MAPDTSPPPSAALRLKRPIDPERDHIRGELALGLTPNVVVYADYLCPYCRRLRHVVAELRKALGDQLTYVFRHFPNERAHPGAESVARATEASARQGRFWDLHDWIYDQPPPVTERQVLEYARSAGLDEARLKRDMESDEIRTRVEEDLSEGRENGVTGTPTLFIDGIRYDGAWDVYSLLEAVERPIAARLQRSARVFASLPASGGLVLLLAAVAALIFANTSLAPMYRQLLQSSFGVGWPGGMLSLPLREWFSEGLMSIFFLLVGLEIRREMAAGALADPRARVLPVVAALGGVLVPAAVYLLFNAGGPTAAGWSVPTATDIAFTLGILALLGPRISPGLRVLVAALAVVDDILSVLTLAIFYPHGFEIVWLLGAALLVGLLFALNRSRVYASWPYLLVAVLLWGALHAAGVDAALAGVLLAAFLPTRPAPAAGPLLAQAATALAALEHAEQEVKQAGDAHRSVEQEPIWDWASRNLSAASDRLLSPADRIERAVAPWTAYVILPLFAFSATGVDFSVDLSPPEARRVLLGVVLGLVLGKPLGVLLFSFLAIKARVALAPASIGLRHFLGAACLCGVSDTVALLMADQAFQLEGLRAIAKIGVLAGSILAATLGTIVLLTAARPAAATSA